MYICICVDGLSKPWSRPFSSEDGGAGELGSIIFQEIRQRTNGVNTNRVLQRYYLLTESALGYSHQNYVPKLSQIPTSADACWGPFCPFASAGLILD